MPKVFISKNQVFGKLGEDIACKFLKNKGFNILETNYTKKWGEIDIVAQKTSLLYFIEVKSKSVSNLSKKTKEELKDLVPEENVHQFKIDRFMRTIQTYLIEKQLELDWRALVLAVLIDTTEKTSFVRVTEIFN